MKVWISFAKFEEGGGHPDEARDIYDRAYRYFKEAELKEERNLLLEAWKAFELRLGPDNAENVVSVTNRAPRKLNKKRMTYADDGTELGYEEYVDYVFPDDETSNSNLKLLQAARLWKQQTSTD